VNVTILDTQASGAMTHLGYLSESPARAPVCVQTGELRASTRMRARLEGAASALEAAASQRRTRKR